MHLVSIGRVWMEPTLKKVYSMDFDVRQDL
jgi:hypothetical protein